MKMIPGCIPCLVKMSITTAKIGAGSEDQIYRSAKAALRILLEGNLNLPAPYFSAPILREVERILKKKDPFLNPKRLSNQAGVKLEGKRALMIGSGGAARAVGFTLAAKAKLRSLTILGIIEPELEKLAGDIAEKTPLKAKGKRMKDEVLAEEIEKAELVIQCTPIGMHPKVDETPIPAKLLRRDLIVMDIVYNPRETRMLREAKAAGAKVIPGLEMFLNQAVLQFEKWTGKPAPVAVMRGVLEKNL